MGNMSGSYGDHYTLWQSITVNSQNITNNTTEVTVRMYLSFDGSSYYSYTRNATSGEMTVNGHTFGYSIDSLIFSSGQAKDILLAEWHGDIGHGNDGRKTLSVSGNWDTNTSRIGSGSCSTSSVLPTIPRTSSISCSGGNIGSNTTIVINRASASFTHTLTYQFGTLSGTITTKTSATSINFTIPNDFYKMIPNSKSGTGTISCTTYSGDTAIGSSSTSFVANAVESASKPRVTATLTDTNSKTTSLTGSNKIMVLNASIGSLVITTTLQKNAGSIKSVTVNGASVGTSASITKTYSPVTTSTFTIVATDSRGYSTTIKLSPTVKNYIIPTVNATFSRPSPTTGQINLKYSGNWFNGSFGSVTNTLTVSYKWKLSTESSYTAGTTTITPTISGNSYSKSDTSLGTSFTYTNSYDFVLTISDKINTITYSQRVSQGLPIIQWNKDMFQVNGAVISNTNRTKLESINGRITNANISHTYENNRAHMQLLQASGSMTNKPAADGYILHCSWDNAGKYNGQLYLPNSNANIPVQFRGCANGTWGEWENLYRSKILFDNSSGTTGTVTLNESSANFKYLEIFFGANKQISSVKYSGERGTEVNLVYGFYSGGLVSVETVMCKISGTTITKGTSYTFNKDSQTVSNDLAIYRVLGYR